MKDIFLKLMFNVLKKDLPFLPDRIKTKKVQKFLEKFHDKKEIFKTNIKFNKNTWLKPYIDMNTELRKKAKHDFQKLF